MTELLSPFVPFFLLSLLATCGVEFGPHWNPIGTAILILGAAYSLARLQVIRSRPRVIVQTLWAISLLVQILILVSGQAAYAFNSDDPRIGIPNVRKCVEIVESGLDLYEFDNDKKETEIITACRYADDHCVRTVLDHLPSLEKQERSQVLPIVRECQLGMGGCFEMRIEKMSSIDYANAKAALKILKKCN